VLEQRIASADEFSHADMNHDGSLTVQDILLLQKLLLQSWLNIDGQQSGPQAEPAWVAAWLDPFITPAHAVPATSGTLYYIHNDQLGTPQALTDESGVVVWTGEYDPFGKATVNDDADADGNAVAFNVRLPGQYYDQETGLHYNYFRYYDPGTGRYLTSDPIGLSGGLNTYAYVGGNPLNEIDPTGEAGVKECLKVIKKCGACVENSKNCRRDHSDPVQCLERGENTGSSVGGHLFNECYRKNPECAECTIDLISCGFMIPTPKPPTPDIPKPRSPPKPGE